MDLLGGLGADLTTDVQPGAINWRECRVQDYLGGQSRSQLRKLLRRLIRQGAEGPKVDFKSAFNLKDKAAQAELAKDISSIANTDDEANLDDFGYIIVGAEKGALVGGVTELEGDIDKLQAQVTDIVKRYVGPVPQFSISAFRDNSAGAWGAIVISPSARQPHQFIRDGASDVVKHEWWVRVNDTKERAGPHDYARIVAKAIRREVAPLEREVQRLALKLKRLPPLSPATVARAAKVTKASALSSNSASGSMEQDLALEVRRHLGHGSTLVEEALLTEALELFNVMSETTPQNPWDFSEAKPPELLAILSYLEGRTFPLAEALAAAARYDKTGVLTDAICRSLQVIAKEPQPVGVHSAVSSKFRLYPLVLSLYAVLIVAVNEGRQDLIKRVLSLRLQREGHDPAGPVIVSVQRMRATFNLFNVAMGRDYFEPIATRIREVMIPRLSLLLAGTAARDAFYIGEFVMGLAFLRISETALGNRLPLTGCYTYESGAQHPIKDFLAQQPVWLSEALGEPLSSLLTTFDETIGKGIKQRAWADGFRSGAARAFDGLDKH